MCNYVALPYLAVNHGCSCATLELPGTFTMEQNFNTQVSLPLMVRMEGMRIEMLCPGTDIHHVAT